MEGGLELRTVFGLDHLDPEGQLLEHVVNAIGLCFVADRTCAFPVSEADGEPIPAVLGRRARSRPFQRPLPPSQTEALPRGDTSSGCNYSESTMSAQWIFQVHARRSGSFFSIGSRQYRHSPSHPRGRSSERSLAHHSVHLTRQSQGAFRSRPSLFLLPGAERPRRAAPPPQNTSPQLLRPVAGSTSGSAAGASAPGGPRQSTDEVIHPAPMATTLPGIRGLGRRATCPTPDASRSTRVSPSRRDCGRPGLSRRAAFA